MAGGESDVDLVGPDRDDLLDEVTDAVYALDEEWRFTYLNRRAIERLPRTEEELLGRSVWEVFPEAMETEFYDTFHEAMETGEPTSHEDYYEPHDYWVEVRVFPTPEGVTVFSRDVTDRKRSEKELEAAARSLQALYDVAADPEMDFEEKLPAILDIGREYLAVDTGFLAEIDREEGLQRIVEARGTHELLQPGESCPLSQAYCRKTIESEEGLLAVHDAVASGWEGDPAYDVFELETYIGGRVIVDGDLYGTLCFADREARETEFADPERVFVELLTQWVAHELGRDRLLADLQERNERLEEFASILSHDLRNPLNVASGRLDLAIEEYDDEGLERAREAIDRIDELVEDVLLLVRQEDGVEDTRPVALDHVANEAWETVEAPSATLVVEASQRIDADPGRLRQLLENLYRNAIDHVGPEVTIRVGLTGEGFYVADDGPGVPEDEREQVFEYGHTTAEAGTGLGLSIVERIAEAHGWDVAVTESEEGGARFEFSGVESLD